jgi:PAS domain S-box-containing protein
MGSFGVRSYLFALLGVSTALPVASFGLTQAEHHAQEVSARHDETLRSSANMAAHRVGDFFSARRQDLETLAAAIAATGKLSGDSNRDVLDAHFRISGAYVGTYLGTADGTPVVRATRPGQTPPSLDTNYRDRDYFREVTRRRHTVFSRAQVGKVLSEPSVQIATPIIARDGGFLGYAEGSLDLAQLEPLMLEPLGDDSPLQLTLVDATGRVVLDSTGSLIPLTDVSLLELFGPPNAEAGLRTARSTSDVTMRGAAMEVPGMPGWRVLAAEPKSIIDTLVRQERQQVWWAAGIAASAALFLSAVLSTWLARRFRRLATQIKSVGDAAPESTRPTAVQGFWEPREFQALQSELSHLAKELTTHRRGLEGKVEERTAELATTNERLHVLIHALERAEDGIAITNDNGEFLYVNPALESITGHQASDLLGKTARELHLDPTEESVLAERKRSLRAGSSHSTTFAARRKDGSLFEQECTTWPIPDAQGQSSSYVTLRKDVTAQRRTEQSLRLSERMASLGTLAAGVAHEINNPLTYVLLSLRLAQRQLDRHYKQLPAEYVGKTESALENALDGAERVSEIVKDLRLFSRADETTLEAIDPRVVLDSALRLMGNDIRHRARLECDYRSTPEVTGNHAKLHQVFLNLFINATHAIEEAYGPADAALLSTRTDEAVIRVATDTDENGNCVIEVSDTGVGIAPEYLSKIFDPFFTTKPVGVGTGLGLAMCRSIVASMSGEITVTSELGRGTTFHMVLPRARAASAAPQTMQTQRRTRIANVKLLVVDDNRAVGDSVSATLSDQHQVDVVDSAQAALSRLKRSRYDVILCDLRMPNMNGIELFLALQNEGNGDERRLVFFTGAPISEPTRSFLHRHGRICVAKPISEEQLERAVREVLQDLTNEVPARATGAGA